MNPHKTLTTTFIVRAGQNRPAKTGHIRAKKCPRSDTNTTHMPYRPVGRNNIIGPYGKPGLARVLWRNVHWLPLKASVALEISAGPIRTRVDTGWTSLRPYQISSSCSCRREVEDSWCRL